MFLKHNSPKQLKRYSISFWNAMVWFFPGETFLIQFFCLTGKCSIIVTLESYSLDQFHFEKHLSNNSCSRKQFSDEGAVEDIFFENVTINSVSVWKAIVFSYCLYSWTCSYSTSFWIICYWNIICNFMHLCYHIFVKIEETLCHQTECKKTTIS